MTLEKIRRHCADTADFRGDNLYQDEILTTNYRHGNVYDIKIRDISDDSFYLTKRIITAKEVLFIARDLGLRINAPINGFSSFYDTKYLAFDFYMTGISNKMWRHLTLYSSQTHHMRWIAQFIRLSYNLRTDSVYELRKVIAKEKGYDLITTSSISGVKNNNPKKQLNISGHLVNFLLARHFFPMDLDRYARQVSTNVEMFVGNAKSLKREYRDLRKKGLITELRVGEKEELWHSFEDFEYAIDAYHLFCKYLKLRAIDDGIPSFLSKVKRSFGGKTVFRKPVQLLLPL